VPEEIRIEPREGYLHVEVSGVFDKSRAEQFLRELLEASREHDLGKILVDIRELEGPIPVVARFDLARMTAKERTHPVRMAVLEGEGQVANNRFFEDVAVNRGTPVKVTIDPDAALEWLGIESPD
jgi:hypothetical protein